jgi:hypothetical protein
LAIWLLRNAGSKRFGFMSSCWTSGAMCSRSASDRLLPTLMETSSLALKCSAKATIAPKQHTSLRSHTLSITAERQALPTASYSLYEIKRSRVRGSDSRSALRTAGLLGIASADSYYSTSSAAQRQRARSQQAAARPHCPRRGRLIISSSFFLLFWLRHASSLLLSSSRNAAESLAYLLFFRPRESHAGGGTAVLAQC